MRWCGCSGCNPDAQQFGKLPFYHWTTLAMDAELGGGGEAAIETKNGSRPIKAGVGSPVKFQRKARVAVSLLRNDHQRHTRKFADICNFGGDVSVIIEIADICTDKELERILGVRQKAMYQ